MRASTRIFLAALLMAAVLAVTAGGPAAAGTGTIGCSYETAGAPGPRGNYLRIDQPAGSGLVTVGRSARRLTVSAPSRVDCGGRTATVDNVDRIFLLAESSRRLKLDLRSGPLGPGVSEEDQGAEIEVFLRVAGAGDRPLQLTVVAGRRDNRVTIGRNSVGERINLNPNSERLRDTDVFLDSVDYASSSLRSGLGGGDDTVDGRGPGALGPSALRAIVHDPIGDNLVWAPAAVDGNHLHTGRGRDIILGAAHSDPVIGGDTLIGGPNDDELNGFGGPDRIHTGAGDDTVSAGDGDDRIVAADDGHDRVDCGGGTDFVSIGPGDRARRNCENVVRG